MITKLNQIAEWAIQSKKRWRIAVVLAEDTNSISALLRAYNNGFIEPILIGNIKNIIPILQNEGYQSSSFQIIDCADEVQAAALGVALVRQNEADILMKGLIGTDKFLKAVLNKENGLMIPGGIMSYVGVLEIPAYQKLITFTDPAVLPFPNAKQKIAMTHYALAMSRSLGVKQPKVALISSVEKSSPNLYSSHADYEEIKELYKTNQFGDCIIDGPLDVFLATDKESCKIKKVDTPIQGEADVLIFPNIESCNPFYKGLMQFAGGELAGLIQGTTHPVIVMSRSESANSKYYCIALAMLMFENNKL